MSILGRLSSSESLFKSLKRKVTRRHSDADEGRSSASTKSVVDSSSEPKTINPVSATPKCPAFEDFAAHSTALLSPDVFGGCRVTISRPQFEIGGHQLSLSHMLTLGGYPVAPTQAKLLKALLDPPAAEELAKGTSDYAAIVRHASGSGRVSNILRWSKGQGQIRNVFELPFGICLRSNWAFGHYSQYLPAISSLLRGQNPKALFEKVNDSDALGEVSLEHSGRVSTSTARWASQRGTSIYYASFSQKVLKQLTLGGDLTLVKSNNATMSSFGGTYKHERGDIAVSVGSQPDFSRTLLEGMKKRLWMLRYGTTWRMGERMTLASEGEVMLNKKERPNLRCGCEYLFPQARLLAAVDTEGKLKVSVEDSIGLQFAAELDYPNDDHKVGFGFVLGEAATTSEKLEN